MTRPSLPAAGSPLRGAGGWLVLLGLAACGGPPTPAEPAAPPAPVEEEAPPAEAPAPVADPLPPAAEEEAPGAWAERTLAGLTLAEKVGQMMMPWVIGDFAPEGSASRDRVVRYVQDQGIGGIVMSVGSPTEVAAKINDLQRRARLPLLVAADLETGAGFRLWGAVYMPGTIELGGATNFPSLMAVGAAGEPRLAFEMGRITAEEARAVGVHVPFAPVLDVNNNPRNPIINVRSFGEDPARVAELGAAFVRGIQDHGGLATGKHFPGHGDTETDSHLALPTIRVSRARMDSVELRPFRDAVAVGMRGVMTAHVSVPSLNGGGDPATLSRAVLTDVLRGELGFDGLVFTDAMDMSAVSGRLGTGEAAVRAVLAGADVLVMPASVEVATKAVVDAVGAGRVPEARVDDAVLRILRAKEALGLHREREVDLAHIPSVVGIPAHQAVAEEIAERSITLVRNGRDLLPLRGTRGARVLSVTFRRPSDVLAGRYFNQRLRQTYPRLTTADVDRDAPAAVYDGLLRQARNSALVVVGTYVTAVSYQGTVALPREVSDFVKRVGAAGVPHVVVSFGNPYLITDFPDVQAYLLAWSGSAASQRAAARALLGDIEIRGTTPTAIPGFAGVGDGIAVPRKAAAGG